MNIPALNDDTPPSLVVDPSARQARHILMARRARRDHLPDILFGEPAWECLLQLYIAASERRHLSAEQCVGLSAAPAGTARRWIKLLVAEGLAEQAEGGFLMLTDKARRAIRALFGQLAEGSSPPARRRPTARGR
ncbi:hypothetical protein [Sphingomonas sp. MMS24-J13]|uniref:hypothetical protein n=1 Tax=Sphingomonas sp. MMS24-J13 TaxID=3238686 RepID=UPI0038501A5D